MCADKLNTSSICFPKQIQCKTTSLNFYIIKVDKQFKIHPTRFIATTEGVVAVVGPL